MATLTKKQKTLAEKVDAEKLYTFDEALGMLREHKAKFDETVEVAMNLGVDPRHADQMVRGMVALPSGTGKDVKVAVFAKGDNAEKALAAVVRWAREEFNLEMRGAIVPVSTIRENGLDVAVARYRASKGVDYAMFAGGGVTWTDRQMKEGKFRLEAAPAGARPDLTGLSCRWTPIRARKGNILSLLVLPEKDADPDELARLYHRIIAIEESLERAGHPVPATGPGYSWPPEGLDLEVAATRGKTSFAVQKLKLLAATFIALIFFKTGWKAGAFDPKEYVETTAANADFRKFDDGLKMTIDCDAETQAQLTELLEKSSDAGLIRYGICEQPEAIMTCIVPSVTRNDHVHFLDGSGGGYTRAASLLKEAISSPESSARS